MDGRLIAIDFAASLAAGAATAAGALIVLFVRRLSQPLNDGLLGFPPA